MLRTNLSTRPFYNERVVYVVLVVVALVVVAISIFNVTRIVALSKRHTQLNSRVEQADQRVRALRAEAIRVRRGINPKELDAVSAAAREANGLIDRRTFSWTELFNRFETTLPADLRIAAVRPKIDKSGVALLQIVVIGRRPEDVDAFMENLEKTGAFSGLLSREEHVTDEGLLQATLETRYVPGHLPPATERGN